MEWISFLWRARRLRDNAPANENLSYSHRDHQSMASTRKLLLPMPLSLIRRSSHNTYPRQPMSRTKFIFVVSRINIIHYLFPDKNLTSNVFLPLSLTQMPIRHV